MPKLFNEVAVPGVIVAPVAAKTTVINTGSSIAFLTNDDIDESLNPLSQKSKRAVLTSLYALLPGHSKSVTAGTYNLDFSTPYDSSVVVLIENSKA